MKKLQDLIHPVTQQLKASSSDTQTQAGATDSNLNQEQIQAITYLFGAFELAYHNQFKKAFGEHETLNSAKRLWAMQLAPYSAVVIKRTADKLIKQNTFLPSLPELIKHCDLDPGAHGLPDAYSAYVEACRATNPKRNFKWSHNAIYWAGRTTGWFLLSSEPEQVALPQFEKNYQKLCDKVKSGESIPAPQYQDTPKLEKLPPSKEEQLKHLEALRKSTGI